VITYDVMHRKGSKIGLSAFSLEKLAEVFAAGLRSIELAIKAGVSVGFGTDLLGELHEHQSEEFLLRARVQKPHEILRAATEINAGILGLSGKLGAIRPGAYADLIAVKGDPLRDLGLLQDQGAHLDLIKKAGAVVKRAV
jgi:imidazolonepropionase-like amidohydrolase